MCAAEPHTPECIFLCFLDRFLDVIISRESNPMFQTNGKHLSQDPVLLRGERYTSRCAGMETDPLQRGMGHQHRSLPPQLRKPAGEGKWSRSRSAPRRSPSRCRDR